MFLSDDDKATMEQDLREVANGSIIYNGNTYDCIIGKDTQMSVVNGDNMFVNADKTFKLFASDFTNGYPSLKETLINEDVTYQIIKIEPSDLSCTLFCNKY